MSLVTISSVERMTAKNLADMLLAAGASQQQSPDPSIAIIDVRDDDYIGGHIKSSMHFPSRSLDAMLPTLLRKLEDKQTVVFHCALSQQRGPSAALQYLRAKEEAASPQKGDGKGEVEDAGKPRQKVYVLDRGFVGWQEVYGPDERLTEGYRKELWEEGY
ncbi:Uu.00g024200.m01.CDS01 [Anthostomella pinea]|uniref:Uu.00g024200.m01.CDS01 n=1 Tax=Anthostomella pinea TaxID=933095 RepID=A0AAI8YR65_9PEZI|nr:Uu.00g024200.m01.CDS01 [Anthostomella pinea]